jgi:hypothetical protein
MADEVLYQVCALDITSTDLQFMIHDKKKIKYNFYVLLVLHNMDIRQFFYCSSERNYHR